MRRRLLLTAAAALALLAVWLALPTPAPEPLPTDVARATSLPQGIIPWCGANYMWCSATRMCVPIRDYSRRCRQIPTGED